MANLARKLKRAIKRHGLLGLVGVAAGRVVWRMNWLRPSVRDKIREREKREAAFDEQHGVDTAGCIHQTELRVNNPNQVHAVSYGASDPKYFGDAIHALPIDYKRFVFIDFGSGKGRAILLASDFPFKRIVGVEFSEELHLVAQDNIRRFHSDTCQCEHLESLCMDATVFPLPTDPLVCYFCNPFDETLMSQVLANIQDSILKKPREVFIVYYNPKEGHLIDQIDCFTRIGTIGSVRIWRTTERAHAGDSQ